MTDYIVLVKQVPDVSQITDNAFDPVTGTLLRSRLAGVINDLDTQALAAAHRMRDISGDKDGRVVCVTMGPPTADEVLRYSLSRCADVGVLLTDKALGGADTWATANPLAYTIRKIAKEILNNEKDYFVISGMQSVDGDTAQVPAQVAEELKIPCVAYVTGAEFNNGRFEFTRIISGGSQVVALKQKPAVITIAKNEYPLFAGFAATRWANKTKVIQWGLDDIGPTSFGVKGSKTAVIRVFPPGKSKRKCRQADNAATLARLIVEDFTKSGDLSQANETSGPVYVLPKDRQGQLDRSYEGLGKDKEAFDILRDKLAQLGFSDPTEVDDDAKEKIIAQSNKKFHKKSLQDMLDGFSLSEPSYTGPVWVVAEHDDGQLHQSAYELVGKARELADALKVEVGAVLAGYKIDKMAKSLIRAGADNIYIINDKLLERFDPTAYRKAVADCIAEYNPQIVLFAATTQGRMLAPMVSYRCECGLTADCTGLEIKDNSRRGEIAILLQTRPALGGNVMATICTKNSMSQMATARPGVMKRLTEDKTRKGNIVKYKVEITEDDLSFDVISTEKGRGAAALESGIIVAGGKGMQSRDTYERLLNDLCEGLSQKFGARAEKGASRAAVEQGFAERIVQVGQTGTSIRPKLYVAVGISGAIQHMIGVANTETIVAINSDPEAPIFKQCDYYIVGTAEEILPQLVKALTDG